MGLTPIILPGVPKILGTLWDINHQDLFPSKQDHGGNLRGSHLTNHALVESKLLHCVMYACLISSKSCSVGHPSKRALDCSPQLQQCQKKSYCIKANFNLQQ